MAHWKVNDRPISLLSFLSKVCEQLTYQQVNATYKKKLSSSLSGWPSRYKNQYALPNLLNKWQSCLHKSEVIFGIFMGVSKAFYCLLNSLILAKLYSHGLHSGSQKVLESYLSNHY